MDSSSSGALENNLFSPSSSYQSEHLSSHSFSGEEHSPNSSNGAFTFVDMTKDVAFKIKYEGHKCLKVNKHFRNNENFQNNFFVFKHGNEDVQQQGMSDLNLNSRGDFLINESSLGCITNGEVREDNLVSDSSLTTDIEEQATTPKPVDYFKQAPMTDFSSLITQSPFPQTSTKSKRRHSVPKIETSPTASTSSGCFFHFQTGSNKSAIPVQTTESLDSGNTVSTKVGKLSSNSNALTFVTSSPQNNFTANFNPFATRSYTKNPQRKRKKKPQGDAEDLIIDQMNINETVEKKRKKRKSSLSVEVVESSTSKGVKPPISTVNDKRKRTRANSIDTVNRSASCALDTVPLNESLAQFDIEEHINPNQLLSLDNVSHSDPQQYQLILYSLLIQLQHQQSNDQQLIDHLSSILNPANSQSQPNQNEFDLNFDEIDELLQDFNIVSNEATEKKEYNHNISTINEDSTFNEPTIETAQDVKPVTSSFSLYDWNVNFDIQPLTQQNIPEEPTIMSETSTPYLPFYDDQRQSDLLLEEHRTELDVLFESLDKDMLPDIENNLGESV